MKLHEYQAKELLERVGAPVIKGVVVEEESEIEAAFAKLNPAGPWVVKAQVHAGGRGKAGGVKFVTTKEDLFAKARDILGMQLISNQTGPEGVKVRKIMLVDACEIKQEIYCSILIDRVSAGPLMIASAEGGTEIEELAVTDPDKILQEAIDPNLGMNRAQADKMAAALVKDGNADTVKSMSNCLMALSKAFFKYDASLVEINPLIITDKDEVICLDAKLAIEDNALFRQEEIAAMRDIGEENPKEVEAQSQGLNYIALEGNIGCMVNGAGLAMATMDLIKLHGGTPNNFLDVGGGANKETMTAAFKLLLSDPQVKGILVNIFGGIVRCDLVAEGVLAAAKEVDLKVPLVVRLEGTRSKEGIALLAKSDLKITAAEGFDDATRKIVELVKG